jgi:hypothetical protein
MRSFNMGRFGNSDDPWFRVGTIDVTTTVFVVGVGVLSMFVWAIEGPTHPLLKQMWFTGDDVANGQVWRLLTWPIPNDPDIWTLLLFAVFFMLGSQLEAVMGRRLFTTYLVVLTLVPPVVATLYHLLTDSDGLVLGLRFLELGVLVGFALRAPNARFWPGIPAWGIAAGIVVLDLLQYVGVRGQGFSILFLLTTVAASMLMLRALGFAEEAHWLPKVPLPVSYGGQSKPSRAPSTSRGKKRGRGKLSVASAPTEAPRRELTRLEEAEMDTILEQVSEHGMDSLTPQQRQRLEDHAKRLRRRD